jgi:hypothetical protein
MHNKILVLTTAKASYWYLNVFFTFIQVYNREINRCSEGSAVPYMLR